MENSIIHSFLTSFFALFKAHVNEFGVENKKVVGVVGWHGEEDEQSFSWVLEFNESVLQKLKFICDFLLEHNLTQGDKIIISASELRSKLQEIESLKDAGEIIDQLCSVKIKMIDDGEETDSFFVHF